MSKTRDVDEVWTSRTGRSPIVKVSPQVQKRSSSQVEE